MLEKKKTPKENKTIRIHPRIIMELKEISKKTGLTISQMMRDALEQYIRLYRGEVKLIPRKEIILNEKRQ